jgi:hypothetical protein
MASEIHHAIDRTRTAQTAPARLRNTAAVEMCLRRRHETPVERSGPDRRTGCRRNMNERMRIARAGFDKAHTMIGVRRQAVGEYAASRSRPYYDEIKMLAGLITGCRHRCRRFTAVPAALTTRIYVDDGLLLVRHGLDPAARRAGRQAFPHKLPECLVQPLRAK